MAGNATRLRLKDGSREFEAEGSLADIECLLARVWLDSSDDGRPDSISEPPSKPRVRKAKGSKRNSSEGTGDDSGFDATDFANKLKNDQLYLKIEKHIINIQGGILNKITLVLWRSGLHLTSGQIFKALSELRVRTDLPSVSKCLSKNSKNFLLSKRRTSGGTPAQYGLTAPALAEFKSFLDNLA